MIEDDTGDAWLDTEFPCVDEGFAQNEPVDVVVRPEDIMVVGEDVGMLDRRGRERRCSRAFTTR